MYVEFRKGDGVGFHIVRRVGLFSAFVRPGGMAGSGLRWWVVIGCRGRGVICYVGWDLSGLVWFGIGRLV